VAFQSDREGDLGIFWQRVDGTDTAQRLTQPSRGESHIPDSWSPTADRFLFESSTGFSFSLWTLSVPDRKAEPFNQGRSVFPMNAVFSRDGRWLAYAAYDADTQGVFVEPFPATGAKYRIARNGLQPLWSPDGKELYYSEGALFGVAVTAGRGFEVGSPARMAGPFQSFGSPAKRSYDIMPNGQRFIALVSSSEGPAGVSTQIQVVLNWFEELKQRAPLTK
jgi:Tol biopolymer transport system component